MDKLWIKRLLSLALLIALAVVLDRASAYFLMPQTNSMPLTIKDRAVYGGQVDTVVLGSSLAVDGIDPSVLDEYLSGLSFNFASASQSVRFSLYSLEDALADNPVRRAIVEISIERLTRNEDRGEGIAQIDRILAPSARLAYAWDACGLERLPQAFSVAMRCKLQYLMHGYNKRFTLPYFQEYVRNGGYVLPDKTKSEYGGRGFIAYKEEFVPGKEAPTAVTSQSVADVAARSGEAEEPVAYLDRIVELCRKEGVEVVFVALPMSEEELSAFESGYQSAHEAMDALAAHMGVPFYDFNGEPLRPEGLENRHFKDPKHMNEKGAEILSGDLGRLLSEESAWRKVES